MFCFKAFELVKGYYAMTRITQIGSPDFFFGSERTTGTWFCIQMIKKATIEAKDCFFNLCPIESYIDG